MEELVDSINSVGLLQPIVIRMGRVDGTDDLYPILVDGARRLRALKELKQTETQAIVIHKDSADEAQMAANLVRADLNLIERGRGYLELVKKFPAKYNVKGICNAFGGKPKEIHRLMETVKKINPACDAELGPHIENISADDLKTISEIPSIHQVSFCQRYVKNGFHDWSALNSLFKQLSYSADAIESEKLVASGKAFRASGSIFTADKAVYEEAKKNFEASQKKKYGSDNEERKKLTDKQKAARSAKFKRDRAAREKAKKELPNLIKVLLAVSPASDSKLDSIGREVCEKHVNYSTSRRMAALFGVKLRESGNTWTFSLRRALWDQVFKPMCKTADSVVALNAILSSIPAESNEEEWIKRIVKLSSSK